MQDGCSTCTHPLRGTTSCRQGQCPFPHLLQHVLPPPLCAAAVHAAERPAAPVDGQQTGHALRCTFTPQMVTGGVQGGDSCFLGRLSSEHAASSKGVKLLA